MTGPSYLIKYHHPDRDYYQIPVFGDWSANGYHAIHTQVNHDLSTYMIAGGWGAIFAALGAYLGARFGGPWGAAGGALIGGILGAVFGYVTQAQIGDEAGCVWWWWGIDYNNWFWANAWWLLTNPLGWGASIGALYAMGYLRVGTATFIGAVGIGGP